MAENGETFTELLNSIVDDHLHWRRNYYPQDGALFSAHDRRQSAEQSDDLEDAMRVLLAKLRRSFPFHSPRYLAHQQSEISMPSVLGAIAGMLYNSNNVTSESGHATIELEMEATADLLQMIGYRPPPMPPHLPATQAQLAAYWDAAKKPSAWCHLCSGGTTANMEALWAARNVRYRMPAIVGAALKHGIDVVVERWPGAKPETLADFASATTSTELQPIFTLRPAAAIKLFADIFTEAKRAGTDELVWATAEQNLKSWTKEMANDSPVVFVSGAAHYSIEKAMDVIGLGASAVRVVDTDSRFRLDVDDLRRKLNDAREDGERPLAVIGVIGTTEEGAIDQFDKLVELRSEWERSQQQSFWLHADAAWGGYFLTALRRSPHDTYMNWADRVADASAGAIVRPDPRLPIPTSPFVLSLFRSSTHVSGTLVSKEAITAAIEEERWADALELSRRLPVGVTDVEPEWTRPFGEVSDTLRFGHTARVESPESPPIEVHLDANTDLDVLRALDAIAKADSVTVDPHKMGYQPYACGAIAFQQDGVRDFVRQKAPYITRVDERLTRQPLIHLKPIIKDGVDTYQRSVDPPALFTLEGSRPSSPATGLWTSTRVLKLDHQGHGRLVAEAWRAAQQLAAWIDQFATYRHQFCPRPHLLVGDGSKQRKQEFDVDFVVLTRSGAKLSMPDTNLVIFGATISGWHEPLSLADYNTLNDGIQQRCFISAETGDERYSYGQPYFVSRTDFATPKYSFEAVEPAIRALGLSDIATSYAAGGKMSVLRCTVMNPYLDLLTRRSPSREPFVGLMEHLYRSAVETWAEMQSAKRAKASEAGGE